MSNRLNFKQDVGDENSSFAYLDGIDRLEAINEVYSDPENMEDPFYFLNIGELRKNATIFKDNFLPEDPHAVVAYAVKANPLPFILKTLNESGIDCFDCASLGEIRRVRRLLRSDGQILFNHPIKKSKDIREASKEHQVKHFTAQTSDEIDKIVASLENRAAVENFELAVRMRTENSEAEINLSEKYGAPASIVNDLLKKVQAIGALAGISIHTGSQNRDPRTYETALRQVEDVVSGIKGLVSLNIGGGVPVNYFGDLNFETRDYLGFISKYLQKLKSQNPSLLADEHKVIIEIGRALVASAVDLIVPVLAVEVRDGFKTLYLADGVFGSFSDFAVHDWNYNFEVFGAEKENHARESYRLFGPTCDSGDHMGIVSLPTGLKAGDRLQIRNAGAYMQSQRSNFNHIEPPRVIAYN